MDVTRQLLEWADEQDLRWDVDEADGAEHLGRAARGLQHRPAREPDPADWDTDLLFRLAD